MPESNGMSSGVNQPGGSVPSEKQHRMINQVDEEFRFLVLEEIAVSVSSHSYPT